LSASIQIDGRRTVARNGAKARTAGAKGGEINNMSLALMRKEDALNTGLEKVAYGRSVRVRRAVIVHGSLAFIPFNV
jgi:hypothetical protein